MTTKVFDLPKDSVELARLPAGSVIRKVETADPLRILYAVTHPDHPAKYIEIGPNGVVVTEFDGKLSLDVGDDCINTARDIATAIRSLKKQGE